MMAAMAFDPGKLKDQLLKAVGANWHDGVVIQGPGQEVPVLYKVYPQAGTGELRLKDNPDDPVPGVRFMPAGDMIGGQRSYVLRLDNGSTVSMFVDKSNGHFTCSSDEELRDALKG